MLVFISDVHLTDGTSGTTIVPRAFDKLCRSLEGIIQESEKNPATRIKNVELVLLGDIFDVIRSSLWLRRENAGKNPVRPWSSWKAADKSGWKLEDYVNAIVAAITGQAGNQQCMAYLKDFRDRCAARDVKVNTSYIIGNHDWLINAFNGPRQAIAKFLGMANAASYRTTRFPEYGVYKEYGVMARHGDYYDTFNYEGSRDASSLGDAIVIDLLNRFAVEVQNNPTVGGMQSVVDQLRELDNVRPLLAMPAWIQGVCNEYPGVEATLHKTWNDLVDNFFDIPFVKQHDRFGPDMVDFLEMGMRLSSRFSFAGLKELLGSSVIKYFYNKPDEYRRYAYNEAELKSNNVRYVVYGHTHKAEQVALDVVPLPNNEVREKIYFNTGTWRKVFEQTCMDEEKCEFIGWHVATFVLFYLESEREKERCYETWSGSLGQTRM
jgi:UDP-2,3-diacylglucosamine pyrophosphatase LpxH